MWAALDLLTGGVEHGLESLEVGADHNVDEVLKGLASRTGAALSLGRLKRVKIKGVSWRLGSQADEICATREVEGDSSTVLNSMGLAMYNLLKEFKAKDIAITFAS
jgi:hypothetical protein